MKGEQHLAPALQPDELERIEEAHPRGLSAREVIEIFRGIGVKLAEPTFRKYVQLGLLPRSRRVGRKGKHQGSVGVYPTGIIRRINLIKAMMSEGLTLEDIRKSFVFFRNEIDAVERVLDELFGEFERELAVRPVDREALARELKAGRTQAKELVRRIERIGSRLTDSPSPAAAPEEQLKPPRGTRGQRRSA